MIADNYQCEISDITSNNLHITDFKNLKAGMKLKIPFLTKPVMEILEETESFISDYYPSLNTNFKEEKKKEEVIVKEEIIENISEEIKRVEEEKDERVKPIINNSFYYGNVIPNFDPKYIKKI